MGGLEIFLLPLLLIGLLWFMGAPQRKMRKEQAALMETLAPGAEVMTHGGLYGTVVAIEDDVVVLETAPGVTMRWAKRAVATIVTPLADEDADELDEDVEDEYAEDEYADEESRRTSTRTRMRSTRTRSRRTRRTTRPASRPATTRTTGRMSRSPTTPPA